MLNRKSKRGIKVGNCGWSYLNCVPYFGPGWQKKFASKLQAYAKLFDIVEINSTFYRIPKLSTAEKWRQEVDAINKRFEFTIKVSQLITHKSPFSKSAFWAFDQMKEVARALRARVLLFQSPAGFKPTKKNLELARKFFSSIDREKFSLVWEVRWAKLWKPEIVEPLFSKLKLNQCVDPFRQDAFYTRDLFYYRLHGFGRPSMYNYNFSDKQLKELAAKVRKIKKPTYVLFNNASCYANALTFKKMLS